MYKRDEVIRILVLSVDFNHLGKLKLKLRFIYVTMIVPF
jgi:hypothetical protein